MARRHVHVVVIHKPVTVALLAATTAAMIGLLYELAGRAYVHEAQSLPDVAENLLRHGGWSSAGVLAALMPFVANAFLFVPWGFLAFVAIDTPARPRAVSYLFTVVAGAVFALAMGWWQAYLPTRVTAGSDVIANVAGAFAGAVAGHLRKQVRLRFDD